MSVEEEVVYYPFPIFPSYTSNFSSQGFGSYLKKIEESLKENFLFGKQFKNPKELAVWLDEVLPQIYLDTGIIPPDSLAITLLCKSVPTYPIQSFFLELLKKRLIPEKETVVFSIHVLDFSFQEAKERSYFFAEVKIVVESSDDLQTIKRHIPALREEIASGLHSQHYAQYLLESKTLGFDYKHMLIHQELIRLRQKKPQYFDQDLFMDMGKLTALCEKEFIALRPYRHITRLVSSLYLLRKAIHSDRMLYPQKRAVRIHLMPTQLQFSFGKKNIIGICIAIQMKGPYEFFEERHILTGIRHLIPNVQIVKGSFYNHDQSQDHLKLLYVEMETISGKKLSFEEITILKKHLADEFASRIQTLIPAIFMMRNEEECIRSILTLSQELKYLSDLPQVMISLHQQSPGKVSFLIVMVRLLQDATLNIKEILKQLSEPFEYTLERVQTVGFFRKKYPKEASVFSLSIPKDSSILRADLSLHFYAARQKIVQALRKIFGEFRDYNGGIIIKQVEALSSFLDSVSNVTEVKPDLKETFFYSIAPIELQTLLPKGILSKLFEQFVIALKASLTKKNSIFFEVREENQTLLGAFGFFDPSIKEAFQESFQAHDTLSEHLIFSCVEYQATYILSFHFTYKQESHKHLFIQKLYRIISEWKTKQKQDQVAQLSCFSLPKLLDPRLIRGDISSTLMTMLFDGLVRIDSSGTPQLSTAASYALSIDKKTYVFTLKPTFWSNGEKVTAFDFEYSWKQILSPHFFSPLTYLFYPIKNARKAKACQGSLDEIGVTALDEYNLMIELEHPCEEFLELLAHPIFFPIPKNYDLIHPNWPLQEKDAFVCNGPFKVFKNNLGQNLELVKNPIYWDEKHVLLQKILISKAHPRLAIEKFKHKHSDWLGKPLQPWDSALTSEIQSLDLKAAISRRGFAFNASRFPFHHAKLRRALSLAIDKTALQNNRFANLRPLSTLCGIEDIEEDKAEEVLAHQLFEEALQELRFTRNSFPIFHILQSPGQIEEHIAKLIQHSWKKNLNITTHIETIHYRTLQDRLYSGDFFISSYEIPETTSPLFYLYPFYNKRDKVNVTRWEDPEFQHIFDEALEENDKEKRHHLVQKANLVLTKQAPLIPLFQEIGWIMKKNPLQGVIQYHIGGIMDFKWASLKPEES